MTRNRKPRRKGGHESVNLSLDRESVDVLSKFKKKGNNVSEAVEQYLRVIARRTNHGPSAPELEKIDTLLKSELDKFGRKGDYEKAFALSMVRVKLKPFFDLAELPVRRTTGANVEKHAPPENLENFTPRVLMDRLSEIPRGKSIRAKTWSVEFQGDLEDLTRKVLVGARIEGDLRSTHEFIHWCLRTNLGDHLGRRFSFVDGGMDDSFTSITVYARYTFRWKLGTPLELHYPDYWTLVDFIPLGRAKGKRHGGIIRAVWFMVGNQYWLVPHASDQTFHVTSK